MKCTCGKPSDLRYVVRFLVSKKGDFIYFPMCSAKCYKMITLFLLENESRSEIACDSCHNLCKFADSGKCGRCEVHLVCSVSCLELNKAEHKETCDLRQLDEKEARQKHIDRCELMEKTEKENIAKGLCVCGKVTKSRCGICKTMKYCSKDCQRIHWPDHKGRCSAVNVDSLAILQADDQKASLDKGSNTVYQVKKSALGGEREMPVHWRTERTIFDTGPLPYAPTAAKEAENDEDMAAAQEQEELRKRRGKGEKGDRKAPTVSMDTSD